MPPAAFFRIPWPMGHGNEKGGPSMTRPPFSSIYGISDTTTRRRIPPSPQDAGHGLSFPGMG